MSELNVYHHELRHNEYAEFYLKYEADKVIAELKEQVHDYALGLYAMQARAEKEARRYKFKRCLAMAKLCNEKWLVHNFAEIPTKLRFYDKWEKRWLGLADKFKEAK